MAAVTPAPGQPRPARQYAALLPLAPGVYRFRDQAGRVLYLGRAVSLRRRVQSYWGDLGDRRHLRVMVGRIARVEAIVCDSAHEAAWLERNLLERSLPPWNRDRHGGQESEVWIRLSESSRAPGLSVVYQPCGGPGREFGPFLGGQKVRAAVFGLERLFPLGYSADGPAGTERDMARIRGATPAARPALARELAAVLDRDPAAVAAAQAELAVRRDAAAAALAFEFAGRLQAALEALDWICGEQKVTAAAGPDADACGWAGGVLVSLAIRGGRMCGWRQRRCGPAAARRHTGMTPPGWAGFAQRAAELAARLTPG
jgi:excinuclease ABC subunit C